MIVRNCCLLICVRGMRATSLIVEYSYLAKPQPRYEINCTWFGLQRRQAMGRSHHESSQSHLGELWGRGSAEYLASGTDLMECLSRSFGPE